jgi:polyisoprenyl-teichoic acid--peptidoglycan teichoic acid transferase
MSELQPKQPEQKQPEQPIEEIIPLKTKSKNRLKSLFFKIFFPAVIFFILFLIFFSFRGPISENSNLIIDKLPIFGTLKHLASSADRQLKNESTGRINILLLGIGGKGHDGAYLTDTIMLVSLDIKDKKIAMLSIPRDLSIPVENSSEWTKINNIDAFAENKTPGSGGVAASEAISDILNVPIDYYARVDFSGFKNLIDKIGGVDVDVQNTLDDYAYPIDGEEDNPDYYARYKHLHVEKGLKHMDGTLALEFSRSRHGLGAEGSDFARAKRQQLVMEAVKKKMLSTNVLLNPVIITEIIADLSEHIKTNLQVWEIVKLWSIFKDIDQSGIINKVIDNSPSGLLYQTISSQGAYILLPKNGDFTEIQYLAQNIFNQVPAEKKDDVSSENPTLEILNGTWINGLANKKAIDMEKYGFKVTSVANSSHQNFDKSIIYDLTTGKKMNSLAILKEKTGATVTFNIPDWLKTDLTTELQQDSTKTEPDFILVVGQDADTTSSGTTNNQ